MSGWNIRELSPMRKICVVAGIGLLILATLLGIGSLLDVIDLNSRALLGQSELRTVASIAVAGCVLAAIGYLEN